MTNQPGQNNNGDESYIDAAFREEGRKLAGVIEHIGREVAKITQQSPATAAYQQAANAIQRIRTGNANQLLSVADRPFFGRLDYSRGRSSSSGVPEPDTETSPRSVETIYVGTTHIDSGDGKPIVSWTAPVAKLWYAPSSSDGYTAPAGHIPSHVHLKRQIVVRNRQLEHIIDIFRRELSEPTTARQNLLQEALDRSGFDDGHLQVIVETIEPEQYENIANVSDRVLIIQGAAGSGKSEIGLHRIAFLLSPHSNISRRERPTADTTLFIGPSQSFLDSASDILPSLGVRERVRKETFPEWLNSVQSNSPRIGAGIWNNLLDKGELTRFNERAEAFKGSVNMADALLRHVKGLAIGARRGCVSLPQLTARGFELDDGRGIIINPTEVEEAAKAVFSGMGNDCRLNRRRDDFVNRITELIWSRRIGGAAPQRESFTWSRQSVRQTIVLPWVNKVWQHLEFTTVYADFLSDQERVLGAARGGLSAEDVKYISDTAREGQGVDFQDSDRGALAYLDHLLNDTIVPRYRHIVVDESQDLSPIEFRVISMSSSNNWFTVLGDTAQRLADYRGVRRWSDLNRVFGRSEIAVQNARTSYRSNQHITRFNNRILRQFDTNVPAPKPFGREGHRPEYHHHARAQDMYRFVVADLERIRRLEGLEDARIAILLRDTRSLNRFQETLEELNSKDIVGIGQEHHRGAKTVFARIPATKGLEYDAVVIVGVNQAFSDTGFNKRLLYLATTRAKHYLGIHWHGQHSKILASIYSGGVKTFKHG